MDKRQLVVDDILKNIHKYKSIGEASRELHKKLPHEFKTFEGARSYLRRHKKKVLGDDFIQIKKKVDFDEKPAEGKASFNFKGELDKAQTIDELLEAHGIDFSKWQIDRIKVSSCGVTSKIKEYEEGEVVGEKLQAGKNYYISAQLVAKKEKAEDVLEKATDELIGIIKEALKGSKKIKRNKSFGQGKHKLLEVSIFDLHLGKLAWGEETGFSDWDTKIASSAALEAAKDLLEFYPSFERIWLPLGHDWFNSDGAAENDSGGRTSMGTLQDEDTRWAKSLNTGVDVAMSLIEMCLQFAPVDITIMRGNHDEQRCVFLGRLLKEAYRFNDNVFVDDGPQTLKSYRWGDVMLATCHGKMESLQKVIAECALRFPKDFAETKWREIHVGHGHRMKSAGLSINGAEEQSIRWRMLPSLSGVDSYHSRNLFHNQRSAECYLWDKKELYQGHHSYNLKR